MNHSFSTIDRVGRATIAHHVGEDGALFLTDGREIVAERNGQRQTLGWFPRSYPRDLFQWHRLAQRASRSDKCNLYQNRAGKLLGIRDGQAYAIEDRALRGLTHIQGDCVLHGGIGEDANGWSYFGEYFRNAERGPVRIWRAAPDLSSAELAHEFPAGRIRHVHGVYPDPFDSGAMWTSVGDLDHECYLIRTDDRFQSLAWHGDGTQIWRAVKLFFTPTHICWITDTNLRQNHACRMDRTTGELEVGQPIDCSGWYGTEAGGHFLAATTVEPGPGIQSNYASIYVSRDAFRWHEIARYAKDPYRPLKLFKFGVISFPSGQQSIDRFYFSGEGLSGIDGRVAQASLSQEVLDAIFDRATSANAGGDRRMVA